MYKSRTRDNGMVLHSFLMSVEFFKLDERYRAPDAEVGRDKYREG